MAATQYTIMYRYMNELTDTMIVNQDKYKYDELFEIISADHKQNITKQKLTSEGAKYSTDDYVTTLKNEANDELNEMIAESVSKDNSKYRMVFEYAGTKKILNKKYVPLKVGKKVNPNNTDLLKLNYKDSLPKVDTDTDKDFYMVEDSSGPNGYSYILKPEKYEKYDQFINIKINDIINKYCTIGPYGIKLITKAKLQMAFTNECLFIIDQSDIGFNFNRTLASEYTYSHDSSSYTQNAGPRAHTDKPIFNTGAWYCGMTSSGNVFNTYWATVGNVLFNPVSQNIIFVGGDGNDEDHSKLINYLENYYFDSVTFESPFDSYPIPFVFTGLITSEADVNDKSIDYRVSGSSISSEKYYHHWAKAIDTDTIKNTIHNHAVDRDYRNFQYFNDFNNSLNTPYEFFTNAQVKTNDLLNMDIPEHYESSNTSPYIIKDVYKPMSSCSPWFIHSRKDSLKDALSTAETLIKIFGADNIKVVKNVPFSEKVTLK